MMLGEELTWTFNQVNHISTMCWNSFNTGKGHLIYVIFLYVFKCLPQIHQNVPRKRRMQNNSNKGIYYCIIVYIGMRNKEKK